ncbi:MAG: hypothetical protein ACHQQ3_08680 [Gemmatimonadales bacterium]
MNKRQQLALKTHGATIVYLRDNNLRSGPLEVLALELQDCTDQLKELVAKQKEHAKERNSHVLRVAHLRRVVRAQMLEIKRHAPRLLKDLAGVEAARHVPHATAQTSTLIAHANAMIKAVQPHKSEYIRARFRRDFLQRLRADLRALALSAKTVPLEAERLAEVTAAIPTLLRRAREIERAMDGTIGVMAQQGDMRALAWQNAHRMGKVRGRKRKLKY